MAHPPRPIRETMRRSVCARGNDPANGPWTGVYAGEIQAQMTHDGTIAVEWEISGRVQGVGFRAYTEQWARREGVNGYVCNRRDGTVYVCAEGTPGAVSALKARVRRGPALSRVDDVRERRCEPSGRYTGFSVRT